MSGKVYVHLKLIDLMKSYEVMMCVTSLDCACSVEGLEPDREGEVQAGRDPALPLLQPRGRHPHPLRAQVQGPQAHGHIRHLR